MVIPSMSYHGEINGDIPHSHPTPEILVSAIKNFKVFNVLSGLFYMLLVYL